VGRNHQTPGNLIGNLKPIIAAHNVKTEIKTRRRPCRSQDVPVVDVQDIGLYIDFWEAVEQRVSITPVRRCPLAIQKAGGGEHKDTGTDRSNPRAPAAGVAQRLQQDRGRFLFNVSPTRHKDQGCVGKAAKVWIPGNGQSSRCTQGSRFGGN